MNCSLTTSHKDTQLKTLTSQSVAKRLKKLKKKSKKFQMGHVYLFLAIIIPSLKLNKLVNLSISCVFLCPSFCESVSQSVCQSVCHSVCQSVGLSVGLSVDLSVLTECLE